MSPAMRRIRTEMTTVPLLVILLIGLLSTSLPTAVLGSAVAAPPVASGPPGSAATTSSALVVASEQQSGGGGGNLVVSLVNMVKDSVVRTATGCSLLWSNHGTCNEIRKKQSNYRLDMQRSWEVAGLYETETPKELQKRAQLLQGGITYDEYRFLQRGKEYRSKVMNVGFLMWSAPRFLPYALMLNKDMLPSPFQVEIVAGESLAETLSRERAQAVVSTLMHMEKQVVAVSGGYLSSMNIFGKKGQQEKKGQLQQIVAETGDFFQRRSMTNASQQHLMERLAPYLYQTDTAFTRAEQRLCQVPACIVQGIGRAVSGEGVPGIVAQLTPAFLQRGKLVGHIQKIAAADDFLVRAEIDLDTVSKRLLQEACQERLMDAGPHRSVDELRSSLQQWLQLTVEQPAASMRLLASSGTTAADENGGDDDVTTSPSPSVVYYNGNLARTALMAYYGCAAVRDSRCNSRLPQLLYTGGSGGRSESPKQKSEATGSTATKAKRLIPFLRE